MKFVTNPNLPIDSSHIIIGEKYSSKLKESLLESGINVILMPDNPCVDERLSGHADLSVLHLGGNKTALAPYLKGSTFAEKLIQMGAELYFPEIIQGNKYPCDAALNICISGSKIICNENIAEKNIVQFLTKDRGLSLVNIKQGYSKCSVCVLREDVIITSDSGIHKRAVAAGINALKITAGYIDLPGFDYGFIGGASFKINNNTVAFTGLLDNHPDKNSILEFLSLHNIKPVYITKIPVFDIGGAIQIVEK